MRAEVVAKREVLAPEPPVVFDDLDVELLPAVALPQVAPPSDAAAVLVPERLEASHDFETERVANAQHHVDDRLCDQPSYGRAPDVGDLDRKLAERRAQSRGLVREVARPALVVRGERDGFVD